MENNQIPYQPAPVPTPPAKNGLATASLILGILSIFFGLVIGWLFVPAIIGLFLGIAGLVLAVAGKSKGNTTAGLVTSIIGLLLSLIFTISCACAAAAASKAISNEYGDDWQNALNEYGDDLQNALDEYQNSIQD